MDKGTGETPERHWDGTRATVGQYSCNYGTTLMQLWGFTFARLGKKNGNKEREGELERIGRGIATLMGNDIDDDRGTNNWSDGIEGDDTLVAWQDTKEVR